MYTTSVWFLWSFRGCLAGFPRCLWLCLHRDDSFYAAVSLSHYTSHRSHMASPYRELLPKANDPSTISLSIDPGTPDESANDGADAHTLIPIKLASGQMCFAAQYASNCPRGSVSSLPLPESITRHVSTIYSWV